MALSEDRFTTDGLPLLPRGTCIELSKGSGVWAVAGTSGWYVLKEWDLDCQCTRFSYKKECSHLEALRRHLQARDALNAALPLTAAKAKTRATGKPVVPDLRKKVPEMTDAELRAIFA